MAGADIQMETCELGEDAVECTRTTSVTKPGQSDFGEPEKEMATEAGNGCHCTSKKVMTTAFAFAILLGLAQVIHIGMLWLVITPACFGL